MVLSSTTSPVQTFSARSTKQALKRIGLLHRSRHRGRDIKVAAVVYPQTTHKARSPALHQPRRC
jgi:hypothetical protein